MSLASCMYEGRVRHCRYAPRRHCFDYRLYQAYLDLDELPRLMPDSWLLGVERPAITSFRRRDHLGPSHVPLRQAVAELVTRQTGVPCDGPIRLLTNLAHFGFRFNPVSFFYCFDAAGQRMQAIAAEINNTPWGQQHVYTMATRDAQRAGRGWRFELDKRFHISPFMPMKQNYVWRFSEPGDRLATHFESFEDGQRRFDATLTMRRAPLSAATLRGLLLRYPFMTLKVIGAIYFEALRLWLKGAPYHAHPDSPWVRRPIAQEKGP